MRSNAHARHVAGSDCTPLLYHNPFVVSIEKHPVNSECGYFLFADLKPYANTERLSVLPLARKRLI